MALKPYGCSDYRQEMMLLGLKKQLAQPGLDEKQRLKIAEQIRLLEAQLGLD